MPFDSGTDIDASSEDSRTVVTSDLNNDGNLDLIIGRDSAVDTVWLGDGDGTLTLREFVDSPYSAKFFEDWPPLDTDYLDPNASEVKRFKITLEFDSGAGNEYQGATASFDLKFTITDDPTLLGTGGP